MPAPTRIPRPSSAAVWAFTSIAMVSLAPGESLALSETWSVTRPDAVFVQAGASAHATALAAGATWDWPWHFTTSVGRLGGRWEVLVARWSTHRSISGHSYVGQLGLTPALRLWPGTRSDGWYVQAGIGLNYLMPIYRTRDKRFSTAFNFGDHLAIGRQFGTTQQHELSLRVQHFSNAGIRQPNPGENFLQLRYAIRF